MARNVTVRMEPGWESNIDHRPALDRVGDVIVSNAKRNAPVDTGALRASITKSVDNDVLHVGSDLDYSVYVELGTWRTRPQPYLRPALEQTRGVF
jgi:HK97 gp10 family phage protein